MTHTYSRTGSVNPDLYRFLGYSSVFSYRFVLKYRLWLQEGGIHFDTPGESSDDDSQDERLKTPGRPSKPFEECTDAAKRMKVKDLLESRSAAELSLTAQMATRASGSRVAADMIKSLSESPEDATSLKKQFAKLKRQSESQRAYTSEEALALYIDMKLSRHSYKVLRKQALHKGHFIYPSVVALTKAKKECLPIADAITVDETSVKTFVALTAERLLRVQESVVTDKVPENSTR